MELYSKTIDSYNNSEKKLVMIIEEYSPITTEKQEKLFKALLIEGSKTSGYSYSEFENELINNFAPYTYIKSIIGDKIKIRKKVSEMNNQEFNIFLEQSIQFCNEFYELNFKL